MTAEGRVQVLKCPSGKNELGWNIAEPGKAEGGLGTARGQAGLGAGREKQEKSQPGGIWELCWWGGEEGRADLPDIPVLPSWGIPESIPEAACECWDCGASQKTLSIPKTPVWSPGSSFWEGKERSEHPEEQQGCLARSHGNHSQPSLFG